MKQTIRSLPPVDNRVVLLLLTVTGIFAPLPSLAGVDIAQQPLSVAEPVPPNIWFIIDDSGSMNADEMCAPGYTSCNSGVNYATSTRNTLAYNPTVTYDPWYNADGTTQTPANRSSVSTDFRYTTGSTTNLLSNDRIFYFPRNVATGDTGNNNSLYLWKLMTDGTTIRRCDVGQTGNCGTTFSSLIWNRSDGTSITRTVAQEWQNYANWFHYYRGRTKMAKASVSKAFARLGSNFRVGYTSIWDRNKFNIPVSNDNGLFRGKNREDFYTNLFAATGSGSTPLRAALDRAGEYFSLTSSSGPYGPESGSAQVSCRQNFTILTTDGEWNDNVTGWGNSDGTDGPTITNSATNQSYTYKAEPPYYDSRSNTLADVAMYYWKQDLRTNLENNVPISATNPAFWQHMRTFGISIGLQGNIDPNGPYPSNWANPTDEKTKIDDLLHASLNSRGKFVAATNPEIFSQALRDTLDAITNETKSSASGGASSSKIEAGTKVIFSQYTSGSWNGTLLAFNTDATTGLQDSAVPAWNAESLLPVWTSRNMYVNKDGASVQFRFSNLNGDQKSALVSQDVVDYLRGDRSKEQPAGTLRTRAGVLPAFINSQLVFVGPPSQTAYFSNATFTGASAYADYANCNSTTIPNRPECKKRTSMLYIAGNNGMLHAFNSDGVEVYTFLPNFSIMHPGTSAAQKTLKLYTDPRYGLNDSADADWETYKHRYILDGEITVADAYISGAWKTILVATQGRGGSGVFALDITNPNDIKFLWEKSSANSNALGNNLGKPIIAQIANGDWRVVLGNGPNSIGDKAQLIMIKISDGSITAIDTEASGNNGLAGPNLWDSDGDGFFDTAYAGDLVGNIWRFKNLAGTPTKTKLFTTRNARPITAMPLIVRNQKTNKTWVFFGTGQNLNKADQTNMDVHTWYGMIDNGSTISSSSLVARSIVSSGKLGTNDTRTLQSGTEAEIISNGKLGWYIDFTLLGERMITPNTLLGGALFGTTYTPDGSNVCSPDGKSSLWAINPFSGARLKQGIFDLNGDEKVNGLDKVNGLFPSTLDGLSAISSGQPPITVGKDGKFAIHLPGKSIGGKLPVGVLGRQSWREIIGQ